MEQKMAQQQLETLFEFPCQFPIKVMGAVGEDLKAIVLEALKTVGVATEHVKMDERSSQGGGYLSVTATFEATSKQQLDELYQLLTAHPSVKIVL
jgi:putative lipoic acid-binding regulatory protein